jgi:hypothetical protein
MGKERRLATRFDSLRCRFPLRTLVKYPRQQAVRRKRLKLWATSAERDRMCPILNVRAAINVRTLQLPLREGREGFLSEG